MVPMVSGVSTEVRQSAMDAFVTLASHLRPGDCGDQVSFAPCFVAGKWDKSMAIIWGLWGNDINLIDKYWWLICFLMYKILRRYYNIIRLSFFLAQIGNPEFLCKMCLVGARNTCPAFSKHLSPQFGCGFQALFGDKYRLLVLRFLLVNICC